MSVDVLQFFSTADNVTAIAAASFVLWKAGAGVYTRTLGSRRRTALALYSLTPGNPADLVASLFGQPIYVQPRRRFTSAGVELEPDGEQCLYNARHGWLTVHFRGGQLIAFAFMLTDRRFRLAMSPICRGVVTGYLGRTSYDQLWPDPMKATPNVSAYNWGYYEVHNFGRGGNYQSYVFSNTMHGWSRNSDVGDTPALLWDFSPSVYEDEWAPVDVDLLSRFRAVNAPDTVAVFGTDFTLEEVGSASDSGAFDQDDMRNLEGGGPAGWMSRSAFERHERRYRPLRQLRSWLQRT